MLAQLLRTLLGSEPCIRLNFVGSASERAELIGALNEGAQQAHFNFRFTGTVFSVFQSGGNWRDVPAPTVEYDLNKFTRKTL